MHTWCQTWVFEGRSKREWELALVHAALAAGTLNAQVDQLGAQLRISQRKARLLLDEIDLRTASLEPSALDQQLRVEGIEPTLKQHRLLPAQHTGRIELHIERLVLRECFRQLVREQFGLVERGCLVGVADLGSDLNSASHRPPPALAGSGSWLCGQINITTLLAITGFLVIARARERI